MSHLRGIVEGRPGVVEEVGDHLLLDGGDVAAPQVLGDPARAVLENRGRKLADGLLEPRQADVERLLRRSREPDLGLRLGVDAGERRAVSSWLCRFAQTKNS